MAHAVVVTVFTRLQFNGGIASFYYNGYSAWVPIVIEGLREIGCAEHARLLKRYNSINAEHDADSDLTGTADGRRLEELEGDYSRLHDHIRPQMIDNLVLTYLRDHESID